MNTETRTNIEAQHEYHEIARNHPDCPICRPDAFDRPNGPTASTVSWGVARSGRMAHIVAADSEGKRTAAACGLKFYPYWVYVNRQPTAGSLCDKCQEASRG